MGYARRPPTSWCLWGIIPHNTMQLHVPKAIASRWRPGTGGQRTQNREGPPWRRPALCRGAGTSGTLLYVRKRQKALWSARNRRSSCVAPHPAERPRGSRSWWRAPQICGIAHTARCGGFQPTTWSASIASRLSGECTQGAGATRRAHTLVDSCGMSLNSAPRSRGIPPSLETRVRVQWTRAHRMALRLHGCAHVRARASGASSEFTEPGGRNDLAD